ncbi:uncharacterized protein UHOD_11317 [Ustilago sp. UG-2017b]|nr:uncharacterized protein UHOD_11317 [Ustilago sp. UG-2017b]
MSSPSVLLNWKTKRPTLKLDTRFAGPYLVQERVGRRAYHITLPANLRVHDVFHVSMLELARTSSLLQQSAQPVEPPLPDEELEFKVEALIGKHTCDQGVEYKVLWRGYLEEAALWEPLTNLNCPDLIQEYEEGREQRPSPHTGRAQRLAAQQPRSQVFSQEAGHSLNGIKTINFIVVSLYVDIAGRNNRSSKGRTSPLLIDCGLHPRIDRIRRTTRLCHRLVRLALRV